MTPPLPPTTGDPEAHLKKKKSSSQRAEGERQLSRGTALGRLRDTTVLSRGTLVEPMPDQRTFAFIPLALIADACRIGWNPSPALHGTPHGHYSALCEFVCCCGREAKLPAPLSRRPF